MAWGNEERKAIKGLKAGFGFLCRFLTWLGQQPKGGQDGPESVITAGGRPWKLDETTGDWKQEDDAPPAGGREPR